MWKRTALSTADKVGNMTVDDKICYIYDPY